MRKEALCVSAAVTAAIYRRLRIRSRERHDCDNLVARALNGNFGVVVDLELTKLAKKQLNSRAFAARCRYLWRKHGGVLVLRGSILRDITATELLRLSAIFGEVEGSLDDSKRKYEVATDESVQGVVMRIGNAKNSDGELVSMLAKDDPLPAGDPTYDMQTKRPVWHTDSTYRQCPPIGSLLYCKQAPPTGGATCFADMRAAFQALPEQHKDQLRDLECVCSLAHHDAKVHTYSPDYPTLTPIQRANNPPNRVPMVLRHPVTAEDSLYGCNSSTCTIVRKGEAVSQRMMDLYDLKAVEDASVHQHWRSLLPFVTCSCFVIKWQWKRGDCVVWDNRCTIHCATGFEDKVYTREMWRTTLTRDTHA